MDVGVFVGFCFSVKTGMVMTWYPTDRWGKGILMSQTLHGTAIYAYIGMVWGVNGMAYMAYMECLGVICLVFFRASSMIEDDLYTTCATSELTASLRR